MQLFTPTTAKIAHDHKQEEDVAQITYLSITLKKLQDQINIENTNFLKRQAEQRELYGKEKERLQDDLRALEASVAQKERRLIELLIPIDGLKERAELTLKNAQAEALSIMTREEGIAEKEELLMTKLDDISEREVKVAENEMKIESRLKGIEEEAQIISNNHKLLNEEKEKFLIEVKQKEKTLQEKESSITIIERRNKEYLENRTEDLNKKERSLNDRREALERAFKEVEKMRAQLLTKK